jgi:hypothetical protein
MVSPQSLRSNLIVLWFLRSKVLSSLSFSKLDCIKIMIQWNSLKPKSLRDSGTLKRCVGVSAATTLASWAISAWQPSNQRCAQPWDWLPADKHPRRFHHRHRRSRRAKEIAMCMCVLTCSTHRLVVMIWFFRFCNTREETNFGAYVYTSQKHQADPRGMLFGLNRRLGCTPPPPVFPFILSFRLREKQQSRDRESCFRAYLRRVSGEGENGKMDGLTSALLPQILWFLVPRALGNISVFAMLRKFVL